MLAALACGPAIDAAAAPPRTTGEMQAAPAAAITGAAVPSTQQGPRICLALSGGGARGAAHVGVIKALEQMRIPIHCVAGTSMGAIVGAAFASGMTVPEMESAIAGITFERLFTDKPPRALASTPRKADDFRSLAGPEVGLSGSGLTSPKGVISGVALEAELRHLVKLRGPQRFDQLPIPFRAVATNLGDGSMYVFDRGELAMAMRASMAVPAIVAPVNLNGQLLVDGGLSRNLPVDVARSMGADVVIAVNLGTPLLRPDQISGILGVSMQMINILSEGNVKQSLGELGPRDVLVVPELEGFSAADFDNLSRAVPAGEAAVRQVAAQLAPYALPAPDFSALRLAQTVVAAPPAGRIDAIRIEGNARVSSEVILQSLQTQVGDPVDQEQIDLDMRRIYGRGDFESVRPDLQAIDGVQTLVVHVTEKGWGPTYVRFGLALEGALGQQATFNVFGSTRSTWLNRFGAEWRNDFALGQVTELSTSFYQPLSERQLLFVEPRLGYFNRPFDIYLGSVQFAEYRDQGYGAGVDLGANLGEYGELRLGAYFGRRDFELSSGPPNLISAQARTDIGLARASLRIDRLDSVQFARSGYLLGLEGIASRAELGASEEYTRFEGQARTAVSSGAHTLRLAVRGGYTPDPAELPIYAQFQLGGFLNMSGYRQQQLMGPRYAYGRALYQAKLVDLPLLEGVYFGLAFEAARMPQLVSANDRGLFQSGTAFLAADTPLGVAYFGYGYGLGGNQAIYLYLGNPY
jgi:NTE family protein